jgi:tripartite-type tricarboxylate transporter receptor subunit TctC
MNNMKSIFKAAIPVSVFLMVLMTASPLSAKEWPNQPITLVVGWAAGGSSDIVSRTLADSMTKTLGVPVVVENKTGASGHLSLSLVSKAKPDGYTIGFLATTAITDKPFFVKNLPFDPINGFTYLASVFKYGNGWVVRADSPWKTLQEFIDDAKKQPGKLTCGMSGSSSNPGIVLAKIAYNTPGLKGAITIVPFKGGVPALTALLGGHVDSTFQTAEWKPHVDAGKLRLLLLLEKSKQYPNAPTFQDLGYGNHSSAAVAYVAPPGLPEPIREKLEQAIKKATEEPGFEAKCLTPFVSTMYYKPGKEIYKELMALYERNKTIIPKLGIAEE